MGAPKFKKYRSKKVKALRLFGWLTASLAVAVVILGVIAIYEANSIVDKFSEGAKREVVRDTTPELSKQPKKKAKGLRKATTYLLLGSDARPGETTGRSDTTMIVRIYPDNNTASILSIPRDLYVNIPGYGTDRINAAFAYGGVPLLVETLREWLGVPIDHFFQVDFSSFAGVVDTLDGVYLPIDQDYYHHNDGTAANNWSSIDVDHGYQKLNGEDALSFVRFRHLDSDFLRASRQQVFVKEVGKELRDKTNLNDMRKLIEVIADGTTSDINTKEAFDLALTLKNMPSENISRFVMPGTGAMINGASVLLLDDKLKDETIDAWDHPERQIKKQKKKPDIKVPMKKKLAYMKLGEAILASSGFSKQARAFGKANKLIRKKAHFKTARKTNKSKENSLISTIPPERLTSGKPFGHCTPTKLPEGFYWPDSAVRQYKLNGDISLSAYATQSSGVSIIFMWTPWKYPPILNAPNDAVKIKGNTYQVYWEGEDIKMVAWVENDKTVWITNTLQNEVEPNSMIAMAANCLN